MKSKNLSAIKHLCLIVVLLAFIFLLPSCATYKATREGYKVYNKYGFSFEYPRYFVLGEYGIFEGPASYYSGAVMACSVLYKDVSEFVLVAWHKVPKSIARYYKNSYLEESLNTTFDENFNKFFEEVTGRDKSTIERGEVVESNKAGHFMLCQYFVQTDPEDEDFKAFIRLGIWYCGVDQKLYIVIYFNSTISQIEDVIKEHQSYIDHFICH